VLISVIICIFKKDMLQSSSTPVQPQAADELLRVRMLMGPSLQTSCVEATLSVAEFGKLSGLLQSSNTAKSLLLPETTSPQGPTSFSTYADVFQLRCDCCGSHAVLGRRGGRHGGQLEYRCKGHGPAASCSVVAAAAGFFRIDPARQGMDV
jgi:hypothetical protein